MWGLIILAICCAAVAGAPSSKIIGGEYVTIDKHPSIVALLYSRDLVTYNHDCGGTILNTRAILSAAHCTPSSANNYRIRVGSTYANSGGVVHSVLTIINHPQYNQGVFSNNDISILKTPSDIGFNNNVQTAFIAGPNYDLLDDSAVIAAGWGVTEHGGPSEHLKHVEVRVINQETCRQNYANSGVTINENMLCSGYYGVGGLDQCTGDSGGPLYYNGNIVVGVCSFGIGCGEPYLPGVNARVSRYADWIIANA